MENINQQFEEWWKVYGEDLSPMAKNVARSAYRAGYESRPTLLVPGGADRCPVCGDMMEYHALPCELYDENGECHCNAEHAHMTYIAHDKDCPAAPRR